MTLVITSTDNTNTTTQTEENAPMSATADTTIAPIVEETTTSILSLSTEHSTPLALATLANKEVAPTSALLASIKQVINGESVTVAKDCVVTHEDGAYRIDLAEYDMKKALAPVDSETTLAINLPKVASDKLTQGKRYLQNLALVASMLRAVRNVHDLRSVCVAIDSKRSDNVDLVVTYTESIESLALKVARLVSPDCTHNQVALYNALCALSNANQVAVEDLDLPTIPKSYLPKQLIVAPLATAI